MNEVQHHCGPLIVFNFDLVLFGLDSETSFFFFFFKKRFAKKDEWEESHTVCLLMWRSESASISQYALHLVSLSGLQEEAVR